jgi:SAM-dependent methyltransferase
MAAESYSTLAKVYEFLLPDALLEPEGSVRAFEGVVGGLRPGARVLDCSASGELAVGLALRGFEVVATDASAAMVERTRALAARHGASLEAAMCRWEELGARGRDGRFDAVFCVGNSITHAAGRDGRRAALAGMASVLAAGGALVLTSRNWELVRAEGPGLRVSDRLTERDGRRALAIHAWTIPEDWEDTHYVDVAVALLDDAGGVTTHAERLQFWPFTHEALDEDLRAAGLEPESSTYEPDVERYLVTARCP